jgi:hypothetical protein
MEADRWPGTPIPITSEWIDRCVAALVLADPTIWIEEIHAIAAEMSTQAVFRRLLPEEATQQLLGPPKRFESW